MSRDAARAFFSIIHKSFRERDGILKEPLSNINIFFLTHVFRLCVFLNGPSLSNVKDIVPLGD